MKVAILFTGALRTIKKTMRYFKQNLLVSSDFDVFACVQNDTSLSNQECEEWIRQEIGSNLKSIEWYNPNEHADWHSVRNKLVERLPIIDKWKNYLRSSGSVIEYIQLQLAYFKMCNYEAISGLYEYIIRSRTDTIFAKPIDFHWLTWTDAQVESRLKEIETELTLSKLDTCAENIFNYFMTTIISDDLIPNIQKILTRYLPAKNANIPTTVSDLNKYIKTAPYILTIRANNLYIVRREYFYLIPALPSVYGFIKSPYSDDYWFNAENQFQAACYHSGLSLFDYNTLFEDKSLYEYDEKRYFDLEFNILNPAMLYCLVRN